MNAKCDVVMKLSVFGTRTDTHTHTHTHTHKAKCIHRRYVGCNKTKDTISEEHQKLMQTVIRWPWSTVEEMVVTQSVYYTVSKQVYNVPANANGPHDVI